MNVVTHACIQYVAVEHFFGLSSLSQERSNILATRTQAMTTIYHKCNKKVIRDVLQPRLFCTDSIRYNLQIANPRRLKINFEQNLLRRELEAHVLCSVQRNKR